MRSLSRNLPRGVACVLMLVAWAGTSTLAQAPARGPQTAEPPAMSVTAVLMDGKHVVKIGPETKEPYSLVRVALGHGLYQIIMAMPGPSGQPPVMWVVPLTVGGKQPDPQPDPQPNPDPQPDPQPDPVPPPPPAELWGIVIEESSARTPQQAIMLASQKVRDLFPAGGFRLVDKDTPVGTDLKPYIDRAKGKTLPVLYLVDPAGKVYFEGPLPVNVADMEALVAKHKKGGRP